MPYVVRLLLVITLLAPSLSLRAEDSLRLGAGEWPPYISAELADNGPIGKLVTDAFAASGIDSQLEWLPWARALRKAEQTQLDAVFPWYRSKQREQDFLFSDSLASESSAIFHHRGMQFDWNNLEDLKPYRIGVNTGYFYSESFSQAEQEQSLNITRADTERQLIDMLLRGRLDIILMGKAPGEHFIKQAGGDAVLTSHPKVFAKKHMHVLFPKADPNSPERLTAFNRGLRQIKSAQPTLAWAY